MELSSYRQKTTQAVLASASGSSGGQNGRPPGVTVNHVTVVKQQYLTTPQVPPYGYGMTINGF